ncbi:serine O-acetyltransferase [Polyangium fumosum]|uniref:Serine acetyltransferase n=1 Tax=Polyangium fumosum TaxID=889272 RepID=A0A4U1IJI8_9BACT|nr:serine acetyltransferase [Polyangium fumosum]TKC94079.1 serine acetyltransferase [Polyangium fumosum]
MMGDPENGLGNVVDGLIASYGRDRRGHYIGKKFLPSREEIFEIIELLFQVFYPGYYGRQDLTEGNLRYHVVTLVSTLREKLATQIEKCLCWAGESERDPAEEKEAGGCAEYGRHIACRLLSRLSEIRDTLLLDVQAAYDGDPAAGSLDEVILSYPGLLAITVHRVAHELYVLGVPLMPRIMSEWAHSRSGADIHPGATVGESFFIDHATGVVIGETSHIGGHVKIYQGVTLGAMSHPKDERGRVIRDTKRHPTVEDAVTLYANATVLGGQTVVGQGSVVGGSVFLTRGIPKRSRVAVKPPETRVIAAGSQPGDDEYPADFEI